MYFNLRMTIHKHVWLIAVLLMGYVSFSVSPALGQSGWSVEAQEVVAPQPQPQPEQVVVPVAEPVVEQAPVEKVAPTPVENDPVFAPRWVDPVVDPTVDQAPAPTAEAEDTTWWDDSAWDTIWVVDQVVIEENNPEENTAWDERDWSEAAEWNNIWAVDTDSDSSDDEEIIPEATSTSTKPVRVVGSPFTIQFDENRLPILSTVRSIDVTGWETSYCSMIARLNKQQFYPSGAVVRGLWWIGQISVGNATQLAQYGISRGLLKRVPDVDLEAILNQSSAIAVDVYLYKPHKNWVLTLANVTNFDPKDTIYDRYLMQWHRFVAFRANDWIRYALDTIRGTRLTTPQPLSQYIKTPYNRTRWYYIHTDVINGGWVASDTEEEKVSKERSEIYTNIIPTANFSLGPWSMVSFYDTFLAHQLDVVTNSCSASIADDDYFFRWGMTVWWAEWHRWEEDRHIWALEQWI